VRKIFAFFAQNCRIPFKVREATKRRRRKAAVIGLQVLPVYRAFAAH
jgi:hypothetical protein